MTSLPEQPEPARTRTEGNVTYLQTQFRQRVRMMIAFVARREAREEVKRRLKAQGVKVLLSAVTITQLAKEHLRRNAAELLAQAEASGAVRNLRLEHERRLVDAQRKSLNETPVQNGAQQ